MTAELIKNEMSKPLDRSNDLRKSLSKLWDLRYGGDVMGAAEIFADIVAHFQLNTMNTVRNQAAKLVQDGVAPIDIIDILLFRLSQLRNHGQLSLAAIGTEDVAVTAAEYGMPQHFQVLLQRGLNRLANSNFGSALNDFTLASRVSRRDSERLVSMFNEIICLESLSYDYHKKLREFEQQWTLCNSQHEPWANGIRNQLVSLQMREALNQGQLARLRELTEHVEVSSQATYFACLLASLPYWNWADTGKIQDLKQLLVDRPDRYETQFRLGTLNTSLMRNDFDDSHRLDDKIERFYLWVWQWLIKPTPDLLERIILWWEHLTASAKNLHVSQDELPLLRNAARWLGLFAGFDDQMIRKRIANLSTTSLTAPLPIIFDYESHLIDLCVALRDRSNVIAADELKLLKSHPATKIPGFTMPALVASVWSKHEDLPRQNCDEISKHSAIYQFIESLRTLETKASDADTTPGIRVDVLRSRVNVITAERLKKTYESQSILLLIITAANRDSVSIFEILERCFDITSYDPTVHDVKIAHLLVTANRDLKPYLSFKRKKSQIVIDRLSADHNLIYFVGIGHHIIQMSEWRERFARWIKPTSAQEGRVESEISGPAAKLGPTTDTQIVAGAWIKRHQLELVLNLSRATVCRRLSEWINGGLIDKRGEGRATEYRATPQLSLMLKTSNNGSIYV